MKKYLLILLLAGSSTLSRGQSDWNIGLQTGMVSNLSQFSSGDETANALFKVMPLTSGQFNILLRYRINNRFAFQTGFNFNEIGFSYSLAKDYSLLKPISEDPDISSSTCISTIPAMITWNSMLNCRNKRIVIGAGFTFSAVDGKWLHESNSDLTIQDEVGTRILKITETSQTKSETTAGFTWMIGIEKVKPRGNSFLFSLHGTCGFNPLAESTVQYNASGKNYSHTFLNNGSHVALSFAYQFLPFGTRKAFRAAKSAL